MRPKQVTFLVSGVGKVIEPAASILKNKVSESHKPWVAITQFNPAGKDVAVTDVSPEDHVKFIPVGAFGIVAVPDFADVQFAAVVVGVSNVIAGGEVIVITVSLVQPDGSITERSYSPVPAIKIFEVAIIDGLPFLLHSYVNPGGLPLTVTIACPSVVAQRAFVTLTLILNPGTSRIVIDLVLVHPSLAVTSTVYVPGPRFRTV